jgi:catechol 2,3-dioxygenase-like lactoylglutathione lyase family enzyme
MDRFHRGLRKALEPQWRGGVSCRVLAGGTVQRGDPVELIGAPRAGIGRPPVGWRAIPVLGVRDVRRAAEYYRDVLGFELDPRNGVFEGVGDDEPGGVYGIVRRGGAEVHFQIRRGALPERDRERIETDVYLFVPDVDALHEELGKRGARVWGPPADARHGIREIRVEDIDGYRITFGSSA